MLVITNGEIKELTPFVKMGKGGKLLLSPFIKIGKRGN
jgi:hypothetical protein